MGRARRTCLRHATGELSQGSRSPKTPPTYALQRSCPGSQKRRRTRRGCLWCSSARTRSLSAPAVAGRGARLGHAGQRQLWQFSGAPVTATKLPPGFFRPPFSGTFTVVPSRTFSSACCTPSPVKSHAARSLHASAPSPLCLHAGRRSKCTQLAFQGVSERMQQVRPNGRAGGASSGLCPWVHLRRPGSWTHCLSG